MLVAPLHSEIEKPEMELVTSGSLSVMLPKGCVEVRDKRALNSKTFLHTDGVTSTCEIRMEQLHYMSAEKELRSIDTTVKSDEKGTYVEWAPYIFKLHEKGIGFDFQSRETGFARVTLAGIGEEKFDSGASLKPTIKDNQIIFSEVRSGCDIVFQMLPTRIKTTRILKDKNAPRTFEWLCEHDEEGRNKIDNQLIGTDAKASELDLKTEVVELDKGSFRCLETWLGNTKVKDPKTRIKSLSNKVAWPVEIDPTVNASIATTGDDGFETVGVTFTTNYLTDTFGTGTFHGGWHWVLNVPQGATIGSATLTLNAVALIGSGGTGKLYGFKTANAAAFSAGGTRPSTMTKTTAFTTVPAAGTTGSKTFDVASIVQEIVSQATWASGSGHNIAAISSGGGIDLTYWEDYSGPGTTPAALSVTYTTNNLVNLERNIRGLNRGLFSGVK